MKVREFLRKEIWSKETSRKILVGLGLLIVAIQVFHEVDVRWTTPSERRAGRAALVEIDALQSSAGMSDGNFAQAFKTAEAGVQVAEAAAWTTRDRGIVQLLSGYLAMTKLYYEEAGTTLKKGNSPNERILDRAGKSCGSADISQMLRRTWKGELHGLLDH